MIGQPLNLFVVKFKQQTSYRVTIIGHLKQSTSYIQSYLAATIPSAISVSLSSLANHNNIGHESLLFLC